MGYARGIKWSEEKIKSEILAVMEKANLKTMPTQKILKKVTGNSRLTTAISRYGGIIKFANDMGIEHMGRETELGREYEKICLGKLADMGYEVELMDDKHPYDILVNQSVKVDVKAGHLYVCGCSFFTFNLEKRRPTCDIFVVYCINKADEIKKTYVIPSSVMSGKTQLSIGVNRSKYDIYLDKWDLIKKYDEFFKSA